MYNTPIAYPAPYYVNSTSYSPYNMYQCPCFANAALYNPDSSSQFPTQHAPYAGQVKADPWTEWKDYGPEPFVVNIEETARQNNTFRAVLWTGNHLQLTLMSIRVGEDIGLEIHPDLDQFIRIEEGRGLVQMGDRKDRLHFQANVGEDFAFLIPAGKWHNLVNTGNKPLKLYSIYAPPQHPHGTVHITKAAAQAAEENHVH